MKWQLQTAKAKLSELIRRVDAEGPQIITVRGAREYVVIDRNQWEAARGGSDPDGKVFSLLDAYKPYLGLGDIEIADRLPSEGLRDIDFDAAK